MLEGGELCKIILPGGGQCEYRVRVSRRCRRISLRFGRDGVLEAVIPARTHLKSAHDFVRSNLDWIERTLERLKRRRESRRAKADEPDLPAMIDLKANGEHFHVKYVNSPKLGFVSVRIESPGHLTVQGDLSNVPACQEAIKGWLRLKGRKFFASRLEELMKETGLKCSGFAVRDQKSRWASCSAKKRLCLNFRLLFMPPEVVRYVLIHELCHTAEMSHSARFWRLVEKHEPDAKGMRAKLNERAELLPKWVSAVLEY